MMTPQVAALRISRQLNSVENRFDQLLSEHAGLTALLAQSRVDASEPFGNGQAALGRMSKSLEALITARGDVARVHTELERIGQERGDIMIEPKPSNTGHLAVDAADDHEGAIAA
jgi:hypothetical protein